MVMESPLRSPARTRPPARRTSAVEDGAAARQETRRSSMMDEPAVTRAAGSQDSSLLVAVRVRPLTNKEAEETGGIADARVLDRQFVVVAHRPEDVSDPLRGNRLREKRYAFDFALDAGTTQRELYDLTTKGLVDGVLEGFNATVFAYGATGAGKTHTMIGDSNDPGIMVLTLQDLFERIRHIDNADYEYKVTFNYLEVYNENIRDLLSPSAAYLDLREDPIKGMCVAGISDWEVESASEIMELLKRGNKHRSQEPTKANVFSSRSHAVLQVTVESKERTPGTTIPVKVAKLSLIDLAGSERAARTKNMGQRMIEGANINRSLLALGNCINALVDRNSTGKGAYVPFRDSKLTRLLKDSLGGNCRTTMIANISPARSCLEESLNTLKYANRAKNIQLKVSANVSNLDVHIAEYTRVITDLRGEITRLKRELTAAASDESKPAAAALDEAEAALMEGLRNAIMQNFDDRMQIQRSLLDLDELQIQNSSEVGALQRYIERYEETNPEPADEHELAEPVALTAKRLEKTHIQSNQARNEELKKQLLGRLADCDEAAQELQAKFPALLAATDRCSLLEMEFKMRSLEAANMELEEHTLLRENLIKGRESTLTQLSEQLTLQDRIIQQQRRLLEEAGVPMPEGLTADLSTYDAEAERPLDIIQAIALPSEMLRLPGAVSAEAHARAARAGPRARTATTAHAAEVAERKPVPPTEPLLAAATPARAPVLPVQASASALPSEPLSASSSSAAGSLPVETRESFARASPPASSSPRRPGGSSLLTKHATAAAAAEEAAASKGGGGGAGTGLAGRAAARASALPTISTARRSTLETLAIRREQRNPSARSSRGSSASRERVSAAAAATAERLVSGRRLASGRVVGVGGGVGGGTGLRAGAAAERAAAAVAARTASAQRRSVHSTLAAVADGHGAARLASGRKAGAPPPPPPPTTTTAGRLRGSLDVGKPPRGAADSIFASDDFKAPAGRAGAGMTGTGPRQTLAQRRAAAAAAKESGGGGDTHTAEGKAGGLRGARQTSSGAPKTSLQGLKARLEGTKKEKEAAGEGRKGPAKDSPPVSTARVSMVQTPSDTTDRSIAEPPLAASQAESEPESIAQ